MVAVQPEAPGMRAEIVATATRLFAEQGFDGTPIQQIADAVGIRKPSLLYHFASKEELRQAVLDDVLSRWKDTLPSILLAATAGEAQFDDITREIGSFFAADPDRARLLVREALDRPRDMEERLRAHVRPLVANLSVYLRKGQEHGTLRGDVGDVDPEAYMFQTVVLLICGVAFSDSFSGLMPRQRARERLDRELVRIAKSSLFAGVSDEVRDGELPQRQRRSSVLSRSRRRLGRPGPRRRRVR
jgi:AcrR family transcriptional regulator